MTFGWFSEKAKRAGHMSGVYLTPFGVEVEATWVTVGVGDPCDGSLPALRFDDFECVGEVREVVSLAEGECREACCAPD